MGTQAMVLVERYLYDGERVLSAMYWKLPVMDQEIAATDSRIICARRNSFFDVRYESLASIGCYSVYRPGWALLTIALAAAALSVLAASAYIPTSLPVAGFGIDLTALISLISFVGTLLVLLALAALAAFFATNRRGIIMGTSGGTFSFGYGWGRRDEAIAFTKVARAAGEMRRRSCTADAVIISHGEALDKAER